MTAPINYKPVTHARGTGRFKTYRQIGWQATRTTRPRRSSWLSELDTDERWCLSIGALVGGYYFVHIAIAFLKGVFG